MVSEQKYEIAALSLKLIGDCPTDSYPLQKKRHSQGRPWTDAASGPSSSYSSLSPIILRSLVVLLSPTPSSSSVSSSSTPLRLPLIPHLSFSNLILPPTLLLPSIPSLILLLNPLLPSQSTSGPSHISAHGPTPSLPCPVCALPWPSPHTSSSRRKGSCTFSPHSSRPRTVREQVPAAVLRYFLVILCCPYR